MHSMTADPWELGRALPWVIAALLGYYGLRVCGALVLLAFSRRRPGLSRVAVRWAPASLRPVLRRAMAGGLLGVALTGGTALAAPAQCSQAADAVPVLDRGAVCSRAVSTAAGGSAAVAQPEQTAPAARPATYTVRGGDSLWSITAGLLGPQASAAAVAQAWPQLWEGNRAAIGADPGRIMPGTELAVPAGLGAEAAR